MTATKINTNKDFHIRYLLYNERDKLWGTTVNSVGCQKVHSGTPYPVGDHPPRYLFNPQKGRVLTEYQILYITKGKGEFVSKHKEKTLVSEGNMFLLFPDEWHNYKPISSVGWDEYWIGFNSESMDHRIINNFFSKNSPIFNIGIREDVVELFQQALQIAKEQNTGFQQMLSGITNHILGIAYAQDRHSTFNDLKITNQINKAKVLMLENFETHISPEEIANEVEMSYSWFRKIFKQYTGFSPSQYIIELRIQKSRELLTNTIMTCQEIGYKIGFESPENFSSTFKKKLGITPLDYRKKTQGEGIL